MKYLSFIAMAIIALSCSEPEIIDPLEGKWSYESINLYGQPAIKLQLLVVSRGETYQVSVISATVNGTSQSNLSPVVVDPVMGDKIGKINFANGSVIIELTNLDHLGSYPAWYIGGVRIETGNQIYNYPGGGSLIKMD